MKSPIFHFQQFAIRQQDSGMKVGTDGVLLGAWARVEATAKKVVDVGTGTGILALMLAQRYPGITIEAIDINPMAAAEAAENFAQSPWSKRLNCEALSFSDFIDKSNASYDHIICNPPYYLGNNRILAKERNQARNTSYLPLEALFKGFQKLLTPQGQCSLVLPSDREKEAAEWAAKVGFYLFRKTKVRGNQSAPFKRVLLTFSKVQTSCTVTELTLEVSRHQRTLEHQRLVDAFYTK